MHEIEPQLCVSAACVRVCVCCFVLLIPTPEEYRVPRVNPGVTASKLFPPLQVTPWCAPGPGPYLRHQAAAANNPLPFPTPPSLYTAPALRPVRQLSPHNLLCMQRPILSVLSAWCLHAVHACKLYLGYRAPVSRVTCHGEIPPPSLSPCRAAACRA